MGNFTIEEKQITTHNIKHFNEEYTLEAGEKLTDKSELVEIANKTVPSGYRVKVNVTIQAEVEKL